MPDALTFQLTHGVALQQRVRFDARGFHIERQPVRQFTLPRVAAHVANAFLITLLQLDHVLDNFPPGGHSSECASSLRTASMGALLCQMVTNS
jgi:hypothetical protein